MTVPQDVSGCKPGREIDNDPLPCSMGTIQVGLQKLDLLQSALARYTMSIVRMDDNDIVD